ncbi:MAG: sphingomyelin phosphodiesterase [Deltaproteobacteria bacterium]|nr:sphingomyelin phosphodiesterase [Deltaproteobacteria bacterium]
MDVLAYNAWMLPPVADDRVARAQVIPAALEGYDVVVVSELFDREAREVFAEGMRNVGYAETPVLGEDAPERCDSSFGPIHMSVELGLNGGVMIFGKHRVTETAERVFREMRGVDEETEGPACVGEDCCSAKGVRYVRFETDGVGIPECLHVFGTHLQNQTPVVGAVRRANGDAPRLARSRQLRMIRELIDEVADTESCPGPVIVAGDLNLQPSELDEALSILDAAGPDFAGPPSWGSFNHHAESDAPEHLDYVLVTGDWEAPLLATNETRLVRGTYERSLGLGILGRTEEVFADLSDHHAVAGRFEWASTSARARIRWRVGASECGPEAQPVDAGELTPSGGALCAEGELGEAIWCDRGLSGCAEGRRCAQVVDPSSSEPTAFDDYLCWGQPRQSFQR